MGYLDLQSATGSNTGTTTFTALAAVQGDTLQVRSIVPNNKAELIDFGCKHATAGMVRVRSPYFHDLVNGIRARTLAADPSGLTGNKNQQKLRPQDTPIVEATGGASAEQVSYWQLAWYDSLSGATPSNYMSAHEVRARGIEEVTNEVAVTGTAGALWGSSLLSSGTGVLKADQMYAVIGYVLDVACTAWGVYGTDTGNLRAGGPGVTTRQFTREWFLDLSEDTGYPCVPVINAQNAGGTEIQVVDSAGATAVNVDLQLVRLGTPGQLGIRNP
jgi:hypothetical protein